MENSLDIQAWRNKYIYQINESEDDEWDLGDLGDQWNIKELTVGDIITNDMWDLHNPIGRYFLDYVAPKEKNGFKIIFVDDTEGEGEIYVNIEGVDNGYDFSDDLGKFNDFLKPQYQVVPPETLNEQEEDWDLGDLDDSYWNAQELNIGDTITPEMWNRDNSWTKWFFKNVSSEGDSWKIDRFEDKDEDGEEANIVRIINTSTGDNFHEDFDNLNKYLKPKYQILSPDNPKPKSKNIFKRIFNKLKEQDEDWDLGALDDDYWNVTELTVGDIITHDMWDLKNPDLEDYIDDPTEDWLINAGWAKDGIYLSTETGGEVSTDIKDINSILKPQYRIEYNLSTVNNLLKPQYQIIPSEELQEQDEDWDLGDLGNEWNITELGIGDIITPEMWIDSSWSWMTAHGSVEISDIENDRIFLSHPGASYLIEWDLDTVNDKLKPQYKVFKPLNEQEDDEWDLGDLGQDWNIQELTVGDTITPDMWNIEKIFQQPFSPTAKEYIRDIISKPRKITNTEIFDNEIYWWVEGSNSDWGNWYLKSEFKVFLPETLV